MRAARSRDRKFRQIRWGRWNARHDRHGNNEVSCPFSNSTTANWSEKLHSVNAILNILVENRKGSDRGKIYNEGMGLQKAFPK
ncbi:hypothetical protein TNIN_368401 [Trichonephila inaurata madagascariensis]|uniref:Uncharacterized protein n=1 Tax=Trichonephila inaurata madagascariensis TaxID=2747483 RepID=A0A8X6YWC9_9ARAC|nr:hypothetical protein TNIN_368401 [Trichonephila inaurata madagascariensis]